VRAMAALQARRGVRSPQTTTLCERKSHALRVGPQRDSPVCNERPSAIDDVLGDRVIPVGGNYETLNRLLRSRPFRKAMTATPAKTAREAPAKSATTSVSRFLLPQ
jgi:hypothetical protein